MEYAEFRRRFAAGLIDVLVGSLFSIILSVLLTLFSLLIYGIISGHWVENPIPIFQLLLAFLITPFIYFCFSWAKRNGQTLGNQILHIKVVKVDGSLVSFKQAMVRFLIILLESIFSYIIISSISLLGKEPETDYEIIRMLVSTYLLLLVSPFLPLITMLWDKRKQAIHDKIANTYVIKV